MTQHQCRYPHVPECRHLIHGYFIFKTDDFPDADPCDDKLCGHCDMLRACEQRMLDDDVLAAAHHGQKGYEIGFRKGLDAARKAVEALTDPVPDVERTMWTTNEILAAIDALREERK